jgi:hypothetical protein
MKKLKITIEPSMTDNIHEHTHNISEEMFYLVTMALNNWGPEMNKVDSDKMGRLHDPMFQISDIVMELWIEETYGLERKEWSLVDLDIDPTNGIIEYDIKMK